MILVCSELLVLKKKARVGISQVCYDVKIAPEEESLTNFLRKSIENYLSQKFSKIKKPLSIKIGVVGVSRNGDKEMDSGFC
jgi:hypothetical protein